MDMIFEAHKQEPKKMSFRLQAAVKAGSVLILLALIVWAWLQSSDADFLPIKQVRIEGDFTRLLPSELQPLVTDKVRGGFFSLDVDAIRLVLLAEPWVQQVIVKRIWPDTLRVIVIEQVPVARWGEQGLLNAAGEYFAPNSEPLPEHLPLLSGPTESTVMLLEQFNRMQEQSKAIGFDIATLILDDRRAWRFTLTNGTVVVLGRKNFEERFNRFLSLIQATLLGRVEQPELIDMRYTNGFSIRWKTN